MKKYKPTLLQEYFKEVLHDYQGHNVYDTEHSIARYNERVGKDIFLYTKLLKKGINWIITNNKENVEDRYIFISKKYNFGIQVEWRKDGNDKNKYNGYTATTLSQDEMHVFTKADKQLFLENILEYCETYKSKFKYTLNKANDILNNDYYRYVFQEGLKEEMNLCGFDLFIEAGKIYYTFELIEL